MRFKPEPPEHVSGCAAKLGPQLPIARMLAVYNGEGMAIHKDKTDDIREGVIGYLNRHADADYDQLLQGVKKTAGLKQVAREQVKSVVIPMIAAGKLKYGSGLRIQLATRSKTAKSR